MKRDQLKPIIRIATLILVLCLLRSQITFAAAGTLQRNIDSDPVRDPTQLTYSITLPSYTIETDGSGLDRILVDSYSLFGNPDDPLLPVKVYNYVLPPEVELDSLALEVIDIQTEILPGEYHPVLASLPEPTGGIEGKVNAGAIHDQNPPTYSWLTLLPYGQMRQMKMGRLLFSPFAYDPETGQITVATEITFRFKYDLVANAETAVGASLPGGFSEKARDLAENYSQAVDWYSAESKEMTGPTYDLVIITTNYFVNNSTMLSTFVNHKNDLGYNTLVVTESDYGLLDTPPPNDRADQVRQWLIDH
jgi:hypothetical protein